MFNAVINDPDLLKLNISKAKEIFLVLLEIQIIMSLFINASLKNFLRNSSNLNGFDNKNGQINVL
jgi:hypothetical protein